MNDLGDIDERKTEDVQAAKLVVAYRYMEKRRQELIDQLEEIEKWAVSLPDKEEEHEQPVNA